MKQPSIFFALVFTILSVAAFADPIQERSSIEIEEIKNHQVMVKITKALQGAEVFVYHSSGDLVTIERLNKKKLIIDFKDARYGSYIILVKKNQFTEEYTYKKELILGQAIR